MTDVVVVGVGQTPVGEHWDISLRQLSAEAIDQALHDAAGLQPQALFVGNMLAPQLSGQAHIGALIADYAHLDGIEAATIEAAGASGGAAIRAGYLAIASRLVDVALVVGVEKMTDTIGGEVETALATAGDGDYEAVQGLSQTALAGMLMRRYMHEYHAPRSGFAGFAINAHTNGAGNPNAMFRKAISVETYQSAAVVCDPLNMFDVAPNCDGAAALLLARADLLPAGYSHPRVHITASSLTTDTLALHDRPNPLIFSAVQQSVERACAKARITPLQVDFFEPYDSTSIFTVLSLEGAGFAQRGEGWRLAQNDFIGIAGSMPISTMGGVKARGNPGGATGVYQAVEAVLQLRGLAGKNQAPDARRGMIQCLGGPASTAVTHIFEVV